MKYPVLILFLLLPCCAHAQPQVQVQIDSMIRLVLSAAEDTGKVNLLNRISFLYSSSDQESGIRYGRQSLALAERIQWDIGRAGAYNAIGANYQLRSETDSALENFQKSYQLSERIGNKRGVAKSLGNMGVLYYRQGNYTRGLGYLFRVLKIFEELGDKPGIAIQLSNIANIYEEQKLFAKALHYDSMALAQYRKVGDEQHIALLTGNTGNAWLEYGDYDKAVQYLQDALYRTDKLGDEQGMARNLGNISEVYTRQKDYNKALGFIFRALEILRRLGDSNGAGVAEMNIANCYYKIAKDTAALKPGPLVPANKRACLALAISYAQQAIIIHRQNNSLNELSFAYGVLANAQADAKDYKASIESFLQYSLYKDSVFSVENSRKISSLEAQRELDLKESRIRILTQDNQLKTLSAQKQQLTNRALTGGIAMLLTIGAVLVLYFIRRQRSEKIIAAGRINTLLKDQELKSVSSMLEVQEQERKRIAADLHDRLGSMLSTVKLYFNSVEQQIDNLIEQNREQYHKATSLLDEACDEVRKISHNLVSGELVKFGLVSALNQLRDTILETGMLKMEVLAFGMDKRLDSATEISLYRVIQELMNNILKHSKADKVTIQLNKVDHNLNIVVEDNGTGFDVAAALEKDGMGLRNTETRVKKLQGTIDFDSAKGRGTTTIIDIPV